MRIKQRKMKIEQQHVHGSRSLLTRFAKVEKEEIVLQLLEINVLLFQRTSPCCFLVSSIETVTNQNEKLQSGRLRKMTISYQPGETIIPTGRQSDALTNKQTDKQTNKLTDRQTERQTN